MKQVYKSILASLLNGLIFPFLLYGFQITPRSAPLFYYYAAVVSFSISFLVYKFKPPVEGRSAIKTYLINFLISFLILCGIALIHSLVIAFLFRVI